MSSRPAGQEKLPKKDRKALARELARIERERQAARRRRTRQLGWAGAGTAVVAAGVVAVLVVQTQARAAQVGPQNMASDGIVLTGVDNVVTASRTRALGAGESPVPTAVDRSSGVLDIVLYADYRSPEAATFWSANSSDIESWVTAGTATLEVRPLALLDGASVGTGAAASPSASASPTDTMQTTGDYSARAAGALACVADKVPNSALAVHGMLLAAQPGLTAAGLDDDELVAQVRSAGVPDERVPDCITSGEFVDWARDVTERAADSVPFDVGSVTTSPVVLVGGQEYTGALDDAEALAAFVQEVTTQLSAAAAATASPTAEPSASPTD